MSRQAIDVYRYYVSLYPAYGSGYLALAEAYILAKNQDSALENLRKCLQLDPENSRAKKLLEDLQKKQ
jgi:tetratricopeptide (TPR) repeat protein